MKKVLSSFMFMLCFCWGAWAQGSQVTHEWQFDAPVVSRKTEGWEAINYANPNTVGGILHLTAVTNMGYPDLEFRIANDYVLDPAVSKQIVIKLKNGTSSRRCRFYWVKNGVQYRHDFLVTINDTEFHEYVIDLTHDSRWSGKFESIRFEIPMPVPANSHNTIVSVDYIKLLTAPGPQAPMPSTAAAPFGVNLAGGDFANDDYQYPHAAELDYFKDKGLTMMRVPFKWERLQPELNGAFAARDLNELKNIVWAARTRGMWVLLDMHNYGRRRVNGVNTVIGNPGVSIADAANAWRMIAEEFKDFGNVYYGLMNEPYGMTQHTPWVNIAQGMITAIRTVDNHSPIMVGGESYSSAARWVAESDNLRGLVDPADNLIFEAHVYFDNDASGTYAKTYDGENATPQTGVNRLRPFVEWLKKYNLRGFIGEYSIPDNDSRWNPVLENALIYMKENNINGTYWAAGSRWGNNKMAVHPSSDMTDRPQMQVIEKYTHADAAAPQPQITSPLAANFNVNSTVAYQPKATNSPTSFIVTGLPAGLTYNSATNMITGTIPAGEHTVQLSGTNATGTGTVTNVVLRGMNPILPGILQAEHYNDGGNNVGYFDNTVGNSGNFAYRHDDVDLRTTDITDNFAVTRTATGEWLKYTVNVEQAGSYSVRMRYATATTTASGVVQFKLNGEAISEEVALSPTATKDAWREVVFNLQAIPQGLQTLELHVVNEGFDVDQFEFSINAAPAAPATLTAAAFGSDKINLSWSAVDGASTYTLRRSATENGTYATIAENLTVTSYTDENLAAQTTYFYTVSGTNIIGEGASSAKVSATTEAFAGPAAVTGLTGIAGDAKVVLKWNPVPNITHYLIKRSTTAGSGYEQIATSMAATYTDATTANETTYYYVVSAENELGIGGNSPELPQTPSVGRFSYWTFDENSGTTATDSWSNHVATLGSAVSLVEGKRSNALQLNGAAESFVTLPQGIVSTVTDFTISAWVKPSAYTSWVRLFDFGSNENNTTSYMYLTIRNGEDGHVRYAVRNGSALEQRINTNVQLVINEWAHVAVTQVGTVGIIYVNGVEVGRNETVSIRPADLGHTPQNWIGKSQFSNDPNMRALVDEFRIYKKALTAAEIAALHEEGSAPLSVKGDKQLNRNAVMAYPNPSNGDFRVRVDTPQNGKLTVAVYNTLGVLVHSIEDVKQDVYEKEVNLRGLAAGVYYIRVNVGSFTQTKTTIIK